MRAVAAFLAVNLVFVAGAVVAAGVILTLGKVANSFALTADEPITWFLICLVGISCGIGALWAATRFIGRAAR